MRDFIFIHGHFSWITLANFQTMKNYHSSLRIVPLSGLQLISAKSSRHFLRSISLHGLVSRQSRCPVHSRAELSAHPLARNIHVSNSDNIVSTLGIAAPLDSSLTAQSDRSSIPRSLQFMNKIPAFRNFSGSSLGCDEQSLSLLLNDTWKKLLEWKEKLKGAKDERKVLLDNIRLLDAENWSLRGEREVLKSMLEENVSTASERTRKRSM